MRFAAPLAFAIPLAVAAALFVWKASNDSHRGKGALPEETRARDSYISGVPDVIDGDTLRLAGRSVRLNGIDAPEKNQTCGDLAQLVRCGAIATEFMRGIVGNGTATCFPLGTDRYGRVIARCELGGIDLGREIVKAGWAIAYRRYSNDYVADEEFAKRMKRGLWAGAFVVPEDFRKRAR